MDIVRTELDDGTVRFICDADTFDIGTDGSIHTYGGGSSGPAALLDAFLDERLRQRGERAVPIDTEPDASSDIGIAYACACGREHEARVQLTVNVGPDPHNGGA